MNKVSLWMIGLLVGLAAGVVIVALLAPSTGAEFRQRLAESFRETLAEARRASQARQAELEQQLAQMQGKASAPK